MENTNSKVKKCYNSISCILSVLIIVFIIGSVIYDITVSKPELKRNINEIRENVQQLNEKIDAQQTVYFVATDSTNIANDTASIKF